MHSPLISHVCPHSSLTYTTPKNRPVHGSRLEPDNVHQRTRYHHSLFSSLNPPHSPIITTQKTLSSKKNTGAMTAPDIAPAPLGTDAACAAPTVSDWTVDGVVNKVNMLPVVGITTTAANSCVTYADSGHATTNTKWGTGMHLFSADLSSIVLNPDESISATMPGSKQYDLDVIVFNPMNGVGSGTTCTIQSGTVQDAGGVPATCALTIDANGMVTAVTITNAGTMYVAQSCTLDAISSCVSVYVSVCFVSSKYVVQRHVSPVRVAPDRAHTSHFRSLCSVGLD
jgi:hypothetical protein